MTRTVGPVLVDFANERVKVLSPESMPGWIEYTSRTGTGAETSVSDAYKVPWVFRSVALRANAISALPFAVMNGKNEVDWELTDQMPDLLWRIEAALCLFGKSFLLKQTNSRRLVGLQWLNPGTMRAIKDSHQGIIGFEQNVGIGTPQTFMPEEIVYTHSFNPDDDLGGGVPPVTVADEAVQVARNSQVWVSKFFENGAIPAIVLATDQNIAEAEVERISVWWKKLFQGVKKAFKTGILWGGLKPHMIQSPIKDLALAELIGEVRAQIAVAFGIPQTLLEDAANFACLPGDQLVWTPNGPSPIARLEAGDAIWQMTDHGIVQNHVDAIIPQGIAPVYEIKTPHRTLRASENHPLLCVAVVAGRGPYQEQESHLVWKRADQIQRGDLLVSVEELPEQGQSEVNGQALTEEFLELAGLYIGDGCGSERDGLRFAIPEGPLQDYYAAVAERVLPPTDTVGEPGQGRNRDYGPIRSRKRHYSFTVGSKRAYQLFESLGLTGKAGTKRVPAWVYKLTPPLRLAFLRGYLDADGTVGKDGRLAFGACNKALIHDVRLLIVSCGIPVSNVSSDVGRIGNYGPIELHRFICGYPAYNQAIGSHDTRYLERLEHRGKGTRDGRYIPGITGRVWNLQLAPGLGLERVMSVEHVGDEEVYDLATTGSHTFVAEGLVVHNTAREHRLSFYTETVFPEARLIAASLNRELFADLGFEFVFKYGEVEAVQQDEAQKAEGLTRLVMVGILTRDEAREQLGYEPQNGELPDVEIIEGQVALPSPSAQRMLAAPAPTDDLRKWRKKVAKRNKPVDFESTVIPDALRCAVWKRMEGDIESAFDFLKEESEARDKHERALKKGVTPVLSDNGKEFADRIEAQDQPDYEKLGADLRRAIVPTVSDITTEEFMRQTLIIGVQFDIAVINSEALAWAQQYGYTLVTGLTNTTRDVVSRATQEFVGTPGMTREVLEQLLRPAFGDVRSEMIAVTEVTRSYSQATSRYKGLLADYGIEMVRYWNTRADELVCPICGPYNGQPESVWGGMYPDGPPPHPRCRCFLTLKAV